MAAYWWAPVVFLIAGVAFFITVETIREGIEIIDRERGE